MFATTIGFLFSILIGRGDLPENRRFIGFYEQF
jgi:hypothetical protein